MNIELVKLSRRYKAQFFDMMEEWTKDIAERNTNRSPRALFRNDFHNFDYYQKYFRRCGRYSSFVKCRLAAYRRAYRRRYPSEPAAQRIRDGNGCACVKGMQKTGNRAGTDDLR